MKSYDINTKKLLLKEQYTGVPTINTRTVKKQKVTIKLQTCKPDKTHQQSNGTLTFSSAKEFDQIHI